jgi:hypothetical protein
VLRTALAGVILKIPPSALAIVETRGSCEKAAWDVGCEEGPEQLGGDFVVAMIRLVVATSSIAVRLCPKGLAMQSPSILSCATCIPFPLLYDSSARPQTRLSSIAYPTNSGELEKSSERFGMMN